MVNDPNYSQDITDNATIHVQPHLPTDDSNIMVTHSNLNMNNGTNIPSSTMINAPSSKTTTSTTHIETIYTNHKSNYDVAYGSTGQVQIPHPVQMQLQGATLLNDPTIPEPVYGVNRNGTIAFVAHQPTTSTGINIATDSNLGETRWRDPELEEVLGFLNSPDAMIRASSVGYLQHLSYADDVVKEKTRQMGGIPVLIDLLNRDMIEVKRNVCGALRNLSYGRKNDDNKRAIRDALGIQVLIKTLIENPDNEIRESATSVLWNLSSCEDVKLSIVDEGLASLVSVIIVPYTAWFKSNINTAQQYLPTVNETHWSTVFRNSTGVLRNISSAGAHARKQLRECDGLIESLFFIINSSISRNDVENKLVENCVCILRNLSYRCQETQDPNYDKHNFTNSNGHIDYNSNSFQNSPSSPSSSANFSSSFMSHVSSKVSNNLGCLSFSRRSRSKSKSRSGLLSGLSTKNNSTMSTSEQTSTSPSDGRPSALLPPHHPSNIHMNGHSGTMLRTSTQIANSSSSNATLPRSGISNIPTSNGNQTHGKDLLWHPDVVKPYLALLSGCSNSETLEAAAGAIQNLAACYWPPSVEIRAAVRKERGLPVLVELLRMDRDRVVCVVATALRNLAIDQKNKELIGKYAMPDLVNKLSTGSNDQESPSSDDTIAAVLATLHEVINNNVDFVRSLYESGGLNKLTYIVRNKSRYSPRVQRFASQVLLDMWKFTELRELYKKGGWKESHFITRPQLNSKNSNYSVSSNTIERPMASQQADRSSSSRNIRSVTASVPQNMLQTQNNISNTMVAQSYDPQSAYNPMQMTSLNNQVNNPQALYAQVDRQRKRNEMQP